MTVCSLSATRSRDAWNAPADLYPLYVCAREETDEALADWSAAPARDRRDAFAVYRAAADREDAAATAWLEACAARDADRALAQAA
jgi:hypothetical protein